MKQQVEERLKFLETGEAQTKNEDIMNEVLQELKNENLYVETEKVNKKKKDKKNKKKTNHRKPNYFSRKNIKACCTYLFINFKFIFYRKLNLNKTPQAFNPFFIL